MAICYHHEDLPENEVNKADSLEHLDAAMPDGNFVYMSTSQKISIPPPFFAITTLGFIPVPCDRKRA